MANSKIKFFSPVEVTGPHTGWELQTGGNPSLARQRASVLKSDGDELAAVQYGAQYSYTENYTASAFSGNMTVPNVGAVKNGAHVDSVSVAYSQTAAPTLAVNSHKHATVDGTAIEHDACREYEPSIILPARAIGVPVTLKKKAGDTAVFTLPEGVGIRSLSYQLQCTHVDENDGNGDHLAGDNYDGVETLTIEFTGEVDVADLNLDADWMKPDSFAHTNGNTQATTTSMTLTHHVAHKSA